MIYKQHRSLRSSNSISADTRPLYALDTNKQINTLAQTLDHHISNKQFYPCRSKHNM